MSSTWSRLKKIYGFIFNNKNLPEDLVPYWDFDAPKIPDEPRDASAAACTASALYELSTYIPGKGYKEKGGQDYGEPLLLRPIVPRWGLTVTSS